MDQYTPSSNNNQQPAPQPPESSKGMAVASMVLGIVGFVAWCLPLVGYPVTIVGIVLGVKAKSQGQGGMAVAGIVMSIITLVFTLINSIAGVLMNM